MGEVVRKLMEKAALFVEYTKSIGLSMNASKTQLLLLADAGNVAEVTMKGGREHHLALQHHRAPGSTLRQEAVDDSARSVVALGREATGIDGRKAGQPPTEGDVPMAAILRASHGQVCPRAGGRGQPKTGKRGHRIWHLEQDPGGPLRRCQEHYWRLPARPHNHQRPAQPGRDRERKQDGGEGNCGRDLELLSQQRQAGTMSGRSCSPTTRLPRQRQPGRPGPARSRSP
jgi:hypothetical protein